VPHIRHVGRKWFKTSKMLAFNFDCNYLLMAGCGAAGCWMQHPLDFASEAFLFNTDLEIENR